MRRASWTNFKSYKIVFITLNVPWLGGIFVTEWFTPVWSVMFLFKHFFQFVVRCQTKRFFCSSDSFCILPLFLSQWSYESIDIYFRFPCQFNEYLYARSKQMIDEFSLMRGFSFRELGFNTKWENSTSTTSFEWQQTFSWCMGDTHSRCTG